MYYIPQFTFLEKLLNRELNLFNEDLKKHESKICDEISKSSFLVIGGAGSIGSYTVKEIFRRNPRLLHVVDISENNLAELVRDLRSEFGYIEGEFKTFVIDVGSDIFDKFINDFEAYDYILNFSALKHVRSEKDPYTLMRMIEVNVINTIKTINLAIGRGVKKYFCVSTDKATNPINLMGASKRIMELFLVKYSNFIKISTARFANVAFSDGSLLSSFIHRVQKMQPIVAPDDIRRFFMTHEESAVLCLLSSIVGDNMEIFFPKLDPNRDSKTFWDIASKFLEIIGFEPYICSTEEEARRMAKILPQEGKWACYVSKTDTTGEKDIEEFYSSDDIIDFGRFKDIGVIKMRYEFDDEKLEFFVKKIESMRKRRVWTKIEIVELFEYLLPNFKHLETGKYLDDKM